MWLSGHHIRRHHPWTLLCCDHSFPYSKAIRLTLQIFNTCLNLQNYSCLIIDDCIIHKHDPSCALASQFPDLQGNLFCSYLKYTVRLRHYERLKLSTTSVVNFVLSDISSRIFWNTLIPWGITSSDSGTFILTLFLFMSSQPFSPNSNLWTITKTIPS